ncbi:MULTISPECIES: hypothetical protein [unclassified Streptomyces]|uniref:hypothetical protein n=1 Tax=unclassified Streptomyces TaxID=2593676 RepID=UPI00224F8B50|nr:MULTISPECIES: hypothetical protein [unclassified Streptomyces]MCX4407037.1 hypothetical protein [Streptomyces sp. NBC_01764]MCX5188275.1 hypothetical protein [Streptomyces sp. NBC_00268]
MARLTERLPDLADQLRQEVRQGRVASEQRLKQVGEYQARASRLAAADLPPLGKADIAVLPYTDDESVELARMAVLPLAETMYASRKAALDIASRREMELTVEFGDPELEIPSSLDLKAETEHARATLATVRALLSEGTDVSVGAIQ